MWVITGPSWDGRMVTAGPGPAMYCLLSNCKKSTHSISTRPPVRQEMTGGGRPPWRARAGSAQVSRSQRRRSDAVARWRRQLAQCMRNSPARHSEPLPSPIGAPPACQTPGSLDAFRSPVIRHHRPAAGKGPGWIPGLRSTGCCSRSRRFCCTNAVGRMQLTPTSGSEEKAGDRFGAGRPLSVAPGGGHANVTCRTQHSGQCRGTCAQQWRDRLYSPVPVLRLRQQAQPHSAWRRRIAV